MKPIVVAIIDDDQLYHLHVKIQLASLSPASRVLAFLNGKDGIEVLCENASSSVNLPDCIFLDIEMPIMNGWEFLEKFQQIKGDLKKDIAVYIFSSLADIQTKLAKYPFLKGSLTKPFDNKQLGNILKDFIDG